MTVLQHPKTIHSTSLVKLRSLNSFLYLLYAFKRFCWNRYLHYMRQMVRGVTLKPRRNRSSFWTTASVESTLYGTKPVVKFYVENNSFVFFNSHSFSIEATILYFFE